MLFSAAIVESWWFFIVSLNVFSFPFYVFIPPLFFLAGRKTHPSLGPSPDLGSPCGKALYKNKICTRVPYMIRNSCSFRLMKYRDASHLLTSSTRKSCFPHNSDFFLLVGTAKRSHRRQRNQSNPPISVHTHKEGPRDTLLLSRARGNRPIRMG